LKNTEQISIEVTDEQQGLRLDVYLTDVIEDASRSFVKKLVKDGKVSINGITCTRPGRAMNPSDRVDVELPPPASTHLEPENIPLKRAHGAAFHSH
jgi:23S rRNA pseudouridine1911/1915/1917 synthase